MPRAKRREAIGSEERLEREVRVLVAAMRGRAADEILAQGISKRQGKRVLRRFSAPPFGPVRRTELNLATALAHHFERIQVASLGGARTPPRTLPGSDAPPPPPRHDTFFQAALEAKRVYDLIDRRPSWVEWSVDAHGAGRLWLLLRAVLRRAGATGELERAVGDVLESWAASEQGRPRPAIRGRCLPKSLRRLTVFRPLPREPALPIEREPNRYSYDRRLQAVVTREGGEVLLRNPTPGATTRRHRQRHDVHLLMAKQSGRKTGEIAAHWQLSEREVSRRIRHFEGSALARVIMGAWHAGWDRRDQLDRDIRRRTQRGGGVMRSLENARELFELSTLMGLLPRPFLWRYPEPGASSLKQRLERACEQAGRGELVPALEDAVELWVALESQRRIETWTKGSQLPPPSALPCPAPLVSIARAAPG